ncbi:hypothetical protein I79_018278 [Cricetulus griseus]|uniref:Uncharacterized protein n=1 Tax=Cricetulus griseus TaxID=10029 RepID=G3I4A1_CRIGR|nr:hypothetical protein I79_018278 [Cricetulus griseus]
MATTDGFQDCEEKLEPEEQWASAVLTCGAARCIEGEHSLNGDIHGRDIEGFEHDLEGQQEEENCLTNITASPGLQNAL